jgi:hypothetical protein
LVQEEEEPEDPSSYLRRMARSSKLSKIEMIPLKKLKAVRLFMALDMSDDVYRRFFRVSDWCDVDFPLEWRTLKKHCRGLLSNQIQVCKKNHY